MMDKSFLITTGNQHQYVYSDALCYFLYVPEEMATVMAVSYTHLDVYKRQGREVYGCIF